eukprot:UN02272
MFDPTIMKNFAHCFAYFDTTTTNSGGLLLKHFFSPFEYLLRSLLLSYYHVPPEDRFRNWFRVM